VFSSVSIIYHRNSRGEYCARKTKKEDENLTWADPPSSRDLTWIDLQV